VDDALLIPALRSGDQAVFKLIFQKYGDALYTEACRKTGRSEDAKDIVQELFMDLFLQRETVYVDTTLAPLLFTMLRNKIISHFRKHLREERFRDILGSLQHIEADPIQDPVALRQLEDTVAAQVESMPPQMKKIYQLSRQEGYAPRQVAAILDLSGQTVRNQLSAALRRIREGLDAAGFIQFLFLNIHLIYALSTMP
jgi:RNA polymerase sigma-70 factor (ECF subfamily)